MVKHVYVDSDYFDKVKAKAEAHDKLVTSLKNEMDFANFLSEQLDISESKVETLNEELLAARNDVQELKNTSAATIIEIQREVINTMGKLDQSRIDHANLFATAVDVFNGIEDELDNFTKSANYIQAAG